MNAYEVRWAVTEMVNGWGDNVRHGDTKEVATGMVVKDGESAEAIAAELRPLLEQTFPKVVMGGTYQLERTYSIAVTAV